MKVLVYYWEAGIYLKYCSPHPLSKLAAMQQKVDVSKNLWDGEHKFFNGMKEQCQVFCVKTFL